MIPRAADDALEPRRVTRHRARVNGHNAAAALEELQQIFSFLAERDIPSLLRVKNEHVSVVELFLGREFQSTIRLRAARVEHRHPVGEEPRVIVRARSMGLFAGADEDAQRLGGKA